MEPLRSICAKSVRETRADQIIFHVHHVLCELALLAAGGLPPSANHAIWRGKKGREQVVSNMPVSMRQTDRNVCNAGALSALVPVMPV